jgi:hypothetical protein
MTKVGISRFQRAAAVLVSCFAMVFVHTVKPTHAGECCAKCNPCVCESCLGCGVILLYAINACCGGGGGSASCNSGSGIKATCPSGGSCQCDNNGDNCEPIIEE